MAYYTADACDIADFKALTARSIRPADAPSAIDIQYNIPIYDGAVIVQRLLDPDARRALMGEWATILNETAGVFVLRQAQPDLAAIDAATTAYNRIIARERDAGSSGADHFAAAGKNDRVWNALQKLCLEEPEIYVRYFASPALDAACEAWLGPNYQMTAQINLVHPGGQAQQAHRDYHLGFQSADVCASYPAHAHHLSPALTLQGGLAHVDMTVESGPTKLLPFSQLYRPGYAAWRRDDFRAHFEESFVQLALSKGDALFFNPALFHAAGENRSADIARMVNLFQVSSAFGRAMESVDRTAMCLHIYDALRSGWAAGTLDEHALDAVIAATAEGYSFPTNLDRDPPTNGLAPETQAACMKRMILSDDPIADFTTALGEQNKRRGA